MDNLIPETMKALNKILDLGHPHNLRAHGPEVKNRFLTQSFFSVPATKFLMAGTVPNTKFLLASTVQATKHYLFFINRCNLRILFCTFNFKLSCSFLDIFGLIESLSES